nr:osteopontin-like [Aedes albopictus]
MCLYGGAGRPDHTFILESNSDHHRYRHQQVVSQRNKQGRNFQKTTNRRHQSSENGNHIYFRDDDDDDDDDGKATNEDEDAYDQYDNYHHLEGNDPSRTKRSGGSHDHQLKKFGVYMVRPDENASQVEYSSVVSIRYWQDPTRTPSASQVKDVVKYTRLTSSSNIYVNQISSIRFQAGAVGADADGPDADTVSTRKSREPRRRQPSGNDGGVDKKNRHPKETDSRKKQSSIHLLGL